MNRLCIEQTKSTPQVDFNPETSLLSIRGQSYPENAFKFYSPLLDWMDEFLIQAQGPISIEIDFNLPYINSSSSKCIMMLLDKLEEAYSQGKEVSIKWYYDEENESSLECAEEFREDLSLPFEVIKINGTR